MLPGSQYFWTLQIWCFSSCKRGLYVLLTLARPFSRTSSLPCKMSPSSSIHALLRGQIFYHSSGAPSGREQDVTAVHSILPVFAFSCSSLESKVIREEQNLPKLVSAVLQLCNTELIDSCFLLEASRSVSSSSRFYSYQYHRMSNARLDVITG